MVVLLLFVQSNVSDVLPDGTVSSMPWRKMGVKYSQNEVYLDIIEEVDAILGMNGQVGQTRTVDTPPYAFSVLTKHISCAFASFSNIWWALTAYIQTVLVRSCLV